jgi:hypothetical protein
VGTVNLEELMIDGALSGAARKDPVERSIIKQLMRLKHQNKRLRDHISKTGAWAHLKEIDLWKPFDFYHYFCTKYHEKYRKEYHQNGNIVRAYQKIDAFRLTNQITKQDYKKFIDRAFERYFTNVNVPTVAHICMPMLYNHLMGEDTQYATPEDYHNLEQQLAEENEKFERYVKQLDN